MSTPLERVRKESRRVVKLSDTCLCTVDVADLGDLLDFVDSVRDLLDQNSPPSFDHRLDELREAFAALNRSGA